MKRQFLLVILIGWAITSAAQSGQEYLESYDDPSSYCRTIDVIVAAAPGYFKSIAKTKRKHKQPCFYKSIIQMPGFTTNSVIYDKTSNTYSLVGATFFTSLDSARAAFRRVKSGFDNCIDPSGIPFWGNDWLEGASWTYEGPKNPTGERLKLYIILEIMDKNIPNDEISEDARMKKWMLKYSCYRLGD